MLHALCAFLLLWTIDLAYGQAATQQHSYVAICAIVKQEHTHINEWLQYHKYIGVEKFYIFDHGSNPPLASQLYPHMANGTVEYFYFTDSWRKDDDVYKSSARTFLSPQGWAYDSCFRWFGHRHTYIATLDVDEFVIVRRNRTSSAPPHLPTFLRAYESFGGLLVHWRLFGSSGHEHSPEAGTLFAYTKCIPKEKMQGMLEFKQNPLGFMKSFVNTKYYVNGCNPHMCALGNGGSYVNAQGMRITRDSASVVDWEQIVVHHYVTRSKDDYEAKLQRGSGHSQFNEAIRKAAGVSRGWHYFNTIDSLASATCLEGRRMFRACCMKGKEISH